MILSINCNGSAKYAQTRGAAVVGVLALFSSFACAGEPGFSRCLPDGCVSGFAGFDFHSKWLSYGFNDNDEPVLLPTAELTFFDQVTAGVTPYLDLTDWGANAGRGTRPFEPWEVDYAANARHLITPDACRLLPTSVELGAGYRYEYYPRRCGYSDAQFWLAHLALPDLWLVPKLVYEREVMLDDGTYLNFCLEHGFKLGENVTLTPSAAQGFGDRKRIASYVQREDGRPFDRAGLMDFVLRLALAWQPLTNLTVSGYVAYTDFPFDRHVREAARRHLQNNPKLDSWNFTAGLSVRITF